MSTPYTIIEPLDYGTADKVRARIDALVDEARDLTRDDLTGEAVDRFEHIEAELDELRRHGDFIDRMTRVSRNATAVESGDGAAVRSGFHVNHQRDPWVDYGTTTSAPAEMRDRALAALERSECTDEGAANVDRVLRADETPTTARHILAVSNPHYESLFRSWLRDPQTAHVGWTDAERAAYREADLVRTSLMESNTGAYMVPFTLDPTIRLTNNGAINPIRQLADVSTITTDDWNGVTSAGVTAEWLAEGSQVADATPTAAQVTVSVYKGAAYLEASYELAQDSTFPDQVGRLVADAKDRLEADAFTTGTGSGQPTGVVTTLAATTASRVAGSSGAAGAADFVVADIYAMANALPARYRQNSSWMGEQTILNKIRQFAQGTGPEHAFWADLGVATPATLLGRPVYDASSMDSTIVSGSNDDVLVLGDFRQGYKIADRLGMTLAVNPHVQGANQRPVGKVGYFATWRVGGLAIDPGAFRLLRL